MHTGIGYKTARHRDTARRHAITRAAQRFKKIMTEADLKIMEGMIQDGEATWIAAEHQAQSRVRYSPWCEGKSSGGNDGSEHLGMDRTMLDLDLDRLEWIELKGIISDPTYTDLQTKFNTKKPVQFYQIMKYLWTEECSQVLRSAGFHKTAEVCSGWLVVDWDGRVCADLVGLDSLLTPIETRDVCIKIALKGETPVGVVRTP